MIQFDSYKASLTIVELDESTVVCDKCGSEVEPAVAKLSRSPFPFGAGITGTTARIYNPRSGSSLWCFRGGFKVATRRIEELIMADGASRNG